MRLVLSRAIGVPKASLWVKDGPATFQKMKNTVLSGLTGTRCFVYMDVIVIYARSLAERDVKLEKC